MKRLSNSAILLVSALLINTPAFTADKELTTQPETGSSAQAESILEDNSQKKTTAQAVDSGENVVATATSEISGETVNTEEKNNVSNDEKQTSIEDSDNITETASDTAKIKKPKKETPKEDSPWSEKVSGKQLNTLKEKLEALQELYNVNWRSYRIAEAINVIERADSPQKRNTTLLDDLTRQQTFNIYAITYIYPELLEIHLQNISNRLLDKAKSLVDEIAETEEEAEKIINSYSEEVKAFRKVNDAYIALLDKSEAVLDSIIKTNTKTANLGRLGYYLKNTNAELLKLIHAQLDAFREVSEQATFTIDYCRQQADFIIKSKDSISIKGKYFAEIRSSFKDLEVFLEKYKTQQEFNFHLLTKYYNSRYDELIEMVGKDEIRVGRIKKLVKETSFKPINKSIKILNTQTDLEDIFEKFGFKETDTKLYETLLPYVNDESWHSRYKEAVSEEEKAKQKEESKSEEKPKLIDLEDEALYENDSTVATPTVDVSSEDTLTDSPDQVTEQKEEEGNSGVSTDSSRTSSEVEKVN